ncbi:hypothetical protein B0T21DRAFT_63836 [Apiosordaria backusii]|uniref:AAA+ ATPase domain-containing protein n=1 Tax=Apiosordaria backusii TaxID=314023 RepID=A0AA40DYT8_9PEZI|nr:hypothetical protein B0T21DRAFT_63836 [Apiosordaria backusii]
MSALLSPAESIPDPLIPETSGAGDQTAVSKKHVDGNDSATEDPNQHEAVSSRTKSGEVEDVAHKPNQDPDHFSAISQPSLSPKSRSYHSDDGETAEDGATEGSPEKKSYDDEPCPESRNNSIERGLRRRQRKVRSHRSQSREWGGLSSHSSSESESDNASKYGGRAGPYQSEGEESTFDKAEERARQKVRNLERKLAKTNREWKIMKQMAEEIRRLRRAEAAWKKEGRPTDKPEKQGEGEMHNESVLSDGEKTELYKPEDDIFKHSDTEEPEDQPKAELHRIPWKTFKEYAAKFTFRLTPKECYAIDVLTDLPVLSWVPRESSSTSSSKSISEGQTKGQGPLPERIRIRSTHILDELRIIRGKDLHVEHNDGSDKDLNYIMDLRSSVLTLVRPFRTLVHLKDAIKERLRQLEQDLEESKRRQWCKTRLAHLGCLIEFIDTEIQPKIDYLNSDECQKVSFADLWFLFKHGDDVIHRDRRQAYRVISVFSTDHKAAPQWRSEERDQDDKTQIIIQCIRIDFDGRQVGPVTRQFSIEQFGGEKAITSLEIFPLRFAETKVDREQGSSPFRDQLVERGKMFLQLSAVKHMHYNGLTVGEKEEVDSQVVIDFEKAFLSKEGSGWKPAVVALTAAESYALPDGPCRSLCCFGENVLKDSYVESIRNDQYLSSLMPEDSSKEPLSLYPRRPHDLISDSAVTDDDYLIMSYMAFGFILHSRKWAQLDLKYLAPVRYPNVATDAQRLTVDVTGKMDHQSVPTRLAFDQLVLPDGHKDMVLSLIAQHYRDKASQTGEREQIDIVRGKGKGLVLLLHGAPGVGKTTTAEGVAEMFQKPLLQITCGDLGNTAGEVEAALETHFSLASRWGCILLLDEADVFLAARTPQDFVRNGMVSVFLRVLEYCTGILFLATNRVGDFDEAFGSRIHISLHYPQLDLSSTLKVFELNLDLIRDRFKRRNRELTIDTRAILEHAADYWTKNEHMRWNGRQIRNACNTALALAEFSAQGGDHRKVVDVGAKISLKLEHLEVVSKAYLDFITYLEDVFDKDADRRAKQMMIRAREYKKATEKGSPPHRGLGTQPSPSFTGGPAQVPTMTAQTTGQGLWPPTPQHAQNPSPANPMQVSGYPAAAAQTLAYHGGYPSHLAGQQQAQSQPGRTYSHYTLAPGYQQGQQTTAYQQPLHGPALAAISQPQAQNTAQPTWPAPALGQGQYPSNSMPASPPGQVAPAP